MDYKINHCITNLLGINEQNTKKDGQSFIYAFMVCCIVYILCGYIGYFLFGSKIEQNISSSPGFVESKTLFASSLAIDFIYYIVFL